MSQQSLEHDEPLREKEAKTSSNTNPHHPTENSDTDWLVELKNFAKEFELDRREGVKSTPQADFGIGPVRYDAHFNDTGNVIDLSQLELVDRLVKLEQALGDARIKFEATLLFTIFGKEDPIRWLPASQRLRIRRAGREYVTDHLLGNG